MAVSVAVPAEAMRGRYSFGDDHRGAEREAPDRGPVQNQIAEMAVLLGNTRGSVILGGSVLSALTIGIAVEAAFSPSVLRPGLAGVMTASLLGCVIVCWLRAAAGLLLASRPVLDQLNDHRWRTGAPLDPRRSEEHTSELQSRPHLVCRLLLEKKKKPTIPIFTLKQKKNKTHILQ